MKKMILLSCFIAACLPLLHAKDASPKATDKATSKATMIRHYDSLFRYLGEKKMFNGNVLIAVGGKKIFSRSVGMANLKTGEPLTETSTFELASVSKQFTAAGIMRLTEQKKLTLDQDVQTILPDLPYKGITIRMLLNHTSGLPDYMELFGEHWDSTKIATNKDLVPMLKKYHPDTLFSPGAKWEYSNTGYALLAQIIAQVSGQSFGDYLQQEIFKPLHMNHTFVYSRRLTPRNIPGYAFGYVQDDDKKNILPDDASPNNYTYFLDGVQGDGGVNTTTGDLLLWDNAVYHKALLSPESWKQSLTSVTPKDGKPADYGFGWMVRETPKSGKIAMHSGSWPGYTTFNIIYLTKNIFVVYLSNIAANGGTVQEITTAMKKIALGEPFALPQEIKDIKVADIDKSVYQKYVGVYHLDIDLDVAITTEDGHLYSQATGQGKSEILPETSTLFFIPDYPIKMEFKVAADGQVPSFILYQNGQQYPAKRK